MTFILPSIGGGIIASPTAPPPAFNTYSGSFDGTNDHAITSGTPVDQGDMANGYTFSGWMWRENDPNLASNGGTTTWLGGAYASAAGSEAFPQLRWYLTDEYFAGAAYKRIRWYHGSKTIDNTSILIPKGVWAHLAVTWDGVNTVTTFLDGSQIGQITNSGSLVSRADNMMIGKGNFIHEGLVDEVAYWNSELSASDITAIYNSGVASDLSSYSPVGWWRMGDNDGGTGTTVTDQGSGGNDATMLNGASFSTDVPLAPLVLPSITNSYALSFDGSNDYADCGVLTELHGASTMSLSFWFKSDTSGEGPSMGSRTGSTNQWGFLRAGSVNYVQIVTGGTGKYFSYSSPADTNYHHYLLTFSSGSINFYIDGAAVSISLLNIGSGSVPALHSETVSFDLGRNATFYSHGLMDEVSLFSTALTQREITAIYNSGTPNDISSLSPLGWWRNGDNDSGTGTTVTDQGSGSNDATLTNGPTFSTTVP